MGGIEFAYFEQTFLDRIGQAKHNKEDILPFSNKSFDFK